MGSWRLAATAATAVARRPVLWPTAVVAVRRFAPDRWWRRWPFLPLPDRDLIRFRNLTQYGDADRVPEPGDLVAWLLWCRAEARRGWHRQ